MTQALGSPLAALIGYYSRLEADPNQKVAGYGFSVEKIHFQVVFEPDGTFRGFEDIRDRNERGKPIPTSRIVPDGGGRSGSGVKPFFCWDNTGYALGRDNKGSPDRASGMFAAFRDYQFSFREELVDDAAFTALCLFLEKWNPTQAESLEGWSDAAGLNVVFKLRGRPAFVHESPAVKAAWLRRLATGQGTESVVRGISLVTGESEEIARLHPLIGGVSGANTMGAAIVSFNIPSFGSYGKSQSYNAPIGVMDAFRYTTALKRLLAEGDRRVSIGDATVVFWSDGADAAETEAVFRELLGESAPKQDAAAEDGKTIDSTKVFLKAARQGRLADLPDAPFYILGLSPNASRLSVRFWLSGAVRQFAERLERHAEDLEMIGARPGDPPLVIRGLVSEIMPRKMASESQKKYVAHLAGEIARAVLGGLPYPLALLNAVVRRVRSDSTINHPRAAIIKACLVRNRGKEVPVALDKDHADEAYHLGRLFAALEKTQEDATDGKLNSTIKDSYFGAASATPASVFPRLIRLHQHHMNKIENVGRRVNREKLIGEICGHVGRFAAHLPLERQGLFYIGYYHQRQDFFTKKTENSKETTDE
jgi:CRISPR-associated protein Csd1